MDDEPDTSEILAEMLALEGYETQTAYDGAQALKIIENHRISIALLDVRLPDMTGTSLLNAIKAISPDTDCIMATGNRSVDAVVDALNSGATAYFHKPIAPIALLTSIRDVVRRQRLVHENAQLAAAQRRTIRHLRLLQNLSGAISGTLELNEVLQAVRTAIIDALGYNQCAIYLVDAEARTLEGRWGTTPEGEPEDLSAFRASLDDDGVLSRVAREEYPYVLSSAPITPSDVKITPASEYFHGVLPLRAKGRVVGLVTVDNLLDGKVITDADIQDLLPFTYHAAIAIDNARLFKTANDALHRETLRAAELEMLWKVAQSIASELSRDHVLDTIAQWVRAYVTTDCYAIILFDRAGRETTTLTGEGISRPAALDALFGSADGVGDAVREGATRVVNEMGRCADPALRAMAEAHNLQSMIALPLQVGDEAVGLLAVFSSRNRRFGEREERMLSTLASMTAAAIRNASDYDKERRIAQMFQHELLGSPPDSIGGYAIETKYQSALDEARVGGDFYDVIELPDGRAALLLADVSGKGLKAAVYTAMGKYMFRGLLMDDPSPGRLVERLNAALYRYTEPGMFITLFYGLLDPQTGLLCYANAGHESPLHHMAEHDLSIPLDTTGVVLGVDPNAVYVERQTRLAPGDLLLLYTDGVTDARRGDDLLGLEGLQQVLKEALEEEPPSLTQRIYDKAKEFANGALHDDIAMMTVRCPPAPEA